VTLDLELVSIIIPSYNMAQFLPEAVRSVLDQTYPSIEVQIIDDGSTDDTPRIVKQWEGDSRVHAHRQANGGLSHARNEGIARTHGRFVALLDADDIWLATDKLCRQMLLFENRPEVGIVYSGYERMDARRGPLPMGPINMHRGWVSGELLIENFVSASSVVVRRECFERCGFFDVSLRTGEDYDMWLRLSAHYQFDYLPEPTIAYRIWGGQMSRDHRGRYETGIRTMQRFLENNPSIVDPALVRRAWAHTYVGRGDSILWKEKDRIAAMHDYAHALRFDPIRWLTWRAILRSLLTTSPPSAG
jgi:glycosyltransferase involved in cell wall biosynthesis